MCNNQPKWSQLQRQSPENLSTYGMIRNSIVQSISNMKNKSNDFLSCEKHVMQSEHFLQNEGQMVN